jgi:hypothetical protein
LVFAVGAGLQQQLWACALGVDEQQEVSLDGIVPQQAALSDGTVVVFLIGLTEPVFCSLMGSPPRNRA